jgi:hypothetical protein
LSNAKPRASVGISQNLGGKNSWLTNKAHKVYKILVWANDFPICVLPISNVAATQVQVKVKREEIKKQKGRRPETGRG